MIVMTEDKTTHTTEREKEFIDRIGTFSEQGKSGKLGTRRQLLEKYRKALAKRNAWGSLNKADIQAYVNLAIAGEPR